MPGARRDRRPFSFLPRAPSARLKSRVSVTCATLLLCGLSLALNATTGKVYTVTADFGPPPAATAEQPHPRPAPVPDTFTVLVVGAR